MAKKKNQGDKHSTVFRSFVQAQSKISDAPLTTDVTENSWRCGICGSLMYFRFPLLLTSDPLHHCDLSTHFDGTLPPRMNIGFDKVTFDHILVSHDLVFLKMPVIQRRRDRLSFIPSSRIVSLYTTYCRNHFLRWCYHT